MPVDWARLRVMRYNTERPEDWPQGVRGISMEGLTLLGVHEANGKLYWDGKEIITKDPVRLATPERVMAALATLGTLGTFGVNAGRALGFWN